MDLNDPRRRLQVLNNASPSIRIASQPQQKLTVATAPTQPQPQISIAQPKQYNISVPKAPAPDPNVPNYSNKFKGLTNEGTETKKLFGWDVGKYMGDFGKLTKVGANRDFESNSNDFLKSYDQLGDEVRRIYVNDVIKKAKEGDQVALNTAKVLNDNGKLGGTFSDFLEAANNKAFGWTMNGANFGHQKDVQERLDNFTAGQIGKEFDPITVGTDIGLTIAGGAGAAKLVSKIPAAARIIEAGGLAGKAIPFLADSVGGGLTQEAISKARGRDTSFAQDMATGTAIDVGANLVFKGAGKFTNLFRQGEKSSSVINDIIQEADPAKIQQVMKIDNNLANYLAQETNPDTVKEVLRQMEMDPNIQLPDEVRKRLEKEGISAVRKKDTKYGAEYDPNDSSINFNDQSYATDTNAYHELGHHIFKNKLTPEEQALFKGTGEASQKAAGREGYTPADVNSEDFSDYMQKALTGRIKDVPEDVRPVIQKYAKIAAQEADNVGIAGIKATDAPTTDFKTKVNSKVNQELFDQGLVSGKIFEKNINDLKLGPNTDPTEAPDMAQVAKYIDDISNGKPIDPVIVERGPNGELLVDDGKHRLEALKALGIEDVPVIEKGAKSAVPTPEQAVGDVSKAQTGVSDAAPDGSVKTTSLEDAGTTFADNYNGNLKKPTPTPQVTKTTIKTYPVGTKISGRTYDGNVYHKTNEASIADITKNGLVPSKKDGRLYFHQTLQENLGWGEDAPIIRTKNENVPDLEIVKTATNNTDAPSSARSISPDKLEVSYDNGKTWKSLAPQVGKETDPKVEAPQPTHRTWQELMNKTEKPLIDYKVGDKVTTDTMYGQVTGKITKVPNFSEDIRIKNNSFKIKLDEPLKLPNGRKSPDTITADGRHFSTEGKAMSIDDPTTALKQEALKYKSADEFVKAQGEPVYHGTGSKFDKFDSQFQGQNYRQGEGGFHFTSKKSTAENYATLGAQSQGKASGYVIEAHLKLNKPLTVEAPSSIRAADFYDDHIGDIQLQAMQNGNDGIIVKGNGENLHIALSPDVIHTKQQLTDLYNQAHTEAKTTAPKVEAPQVTKTEPTTVYHGGTPQKAEEIVPNADDETKRAVQEVLDNLNGAQKNFDDAAKIRTQQKAARINSADGAFQSAGGGEAGFRAKLGALKGKYAESGFNPITASESTQNTILNDIESSSLRSFEKLNLQNAMRKIWGNAEGKPTPGEINMIRKYFGEDGDQMAKAIEDAIAEDPKTWRDKIVDIAGVPRAAMASFDFSMGLRQGGQVAVRNFPEWVNANKESIKYVKNADYFKSEMKRIADDDAYETIVDKLGVRLPAVDGNSDEIMASANLLEKIPVYGRGIEASDRAYSGGLTKLRYNIAKKWIDSLGGPDAALKNLSEKDLQDIGEVINTSTGSGGKKGGFTEKNMQTLATTLFAPRLWASRLNAINPAYYARLSPIARRRAIENIASFMGAAGVVVGLAHAAGADVEMDPRSSDFMKIKIGNTRFDVFGGLQQNVVFFARMITGEKKNSSTGEIQTMGDGFGQPNRLDLAQDMFQNKLNPLLGYAARMLQSSEGDTGNPNDRKDKFGEDLNVAQETGKLVVPLGIQGLVDSYNDTGDVGKSVAMNVPNFFGIGTQTYGETATKDQKTDSNGKIAFGGKIQDNMVTDNEGNVMMDEKNRPIKVKFDKDASEIEKKAALKKAQNEAYTKKAKSLLSQEDQDIYAMGQADPNSLDEAQKDKFDQVKKWVSDYGKSVDIPKSVKSDAAKTFYQKYNTMTKKDQENWLKESPDENAKTVATELNKQRVKGLPEYKPSNYLSKEYAEYEKDLLEHPEYTNIDKQNKARAFQTKAYKYNYSEDQRDIFNEGGSSDLKSLIDDGQVSKEDLDAAIKLDEELYNSGLTGSLKFSKKFRNNYGYGTPAGKGGSGGSGAGRGGSGSGGSGGGSGSGESKRAYLSAYVSNGTEGAKKEAPQFSSKRRTTGISFKDVTTPKKSNSKKVTINL